MKIAVFIKSTTLHKNHGGLETQNKVLCEGLVKKGNQVTVFSPKRDLDMSGAEESGVRYVFIDAQYGRKILSGFKKDSWEKMSLEVFEKVNQKEKFDLVLGQSAAAGSVLEKRVELGVKTVSIAHGTTSAEYSTFIKNISSVKDIYWLIRNTQYFLRQYFGRQRKYVFNSDRVVAVSEYVKKSLVSETFVDEKKVTVIHNGVDMDLFKDVEEKRNVGGIVDISFVGRLEKSKGILFLISMIKKINRDIVLHVVGDGPCFLEAQKLVGKLGIQEKVIFHGRLSHKEVCEFTKNVKPDIFVFPTQRIEGFPMVLVESMLAGIPIVAFDRGGVGDAVKDGKTGFLLNADDTKGFEEKLIKLIDDRNLRLDLGKNGKEMAEKEFTTGKMIDNYEKVFLDLLK